MSILSSLLKLGGLAAAPFSGGASLALTAGGGIMDKIGGAAGATNALSAAGQVMGGQQSGKNNARLAQGQLNQGHDRDVLDLYHTQQGQQNQAAQTDLQRQQFATGNRSDTAKQALIGALLGGKLQPTKIGPGGASGGLMASLQANPDALAAMRTLGSQGSMAQHTPLSFQGGQTLAAPKLSDVPKLDEGGGVMGTMAKIAQIAGAVLPFFKKSSDAASSGGDI